MGILLLSVLHHVNLRTIEEPPKMRLFWISYSSLKLKIFFMLLIIFLAMTMLFSFIVPWTIYFLQTRAILGLFFVFILIPKYFISQNENLKLYVSVYHLVPAPVLPWQLPSNFDPNSVKLVCVNYPNSQIWAPTAPICSPFGYG